MGKLKKLLGLCECKGCYKQAKYEMSIKSTNINKNLCKKHMLEITREAKLESIKVNCEVEE